MGTTLVICLFLAAHLHAESTARSSSVASISTSTTNAPDSSSAGTTTSSSPFNVDDELAKIAASCLSERNYEELAGNVFKVIIVRGLCTILIKESVATIGLTELRAALSFAPVRPWQPSNNTKPSEGELASAPTLEAYYDLKEPSSNNRSLDSWFLFESNLIPAIAYLDKRFPSIRTMFRRRFEEIRRSDPGVLDRKAIDRMIVEFSAINRRIRNATEQMHERDDECWNRVD